MNKLERPLLCLSFRSFIHLSHTLPILIPRYSKCFTSVSSETIQTPARPAQPPNGCLRFAFIRIESLLTSIQHVAEMDLRGGILIMIC